MITLLIGDDQYALKKNLRLSKALSTQLGQPLTTTDFLNRPSVMLLTVL